VWEAAAAQGLASKRFTKRMLAQLRAAGWVKAQPLPHTSKKHKSFGYRLNPAAQKQRAAKLQRAVARGGGSGASASAAP
jgi:hypothetical protein